MRKLKAFIVLNTLLILVSPFLSSINAISAALPPIKSTPLVSSTSAPIDTNSMLKPVIYPSTNIVGLLGESIYYTIVFRGNGEAIVSMKAILTNSTNYPISNIQLNASNITPKDLIGYQVIQKPHCIRTISQLNPNNTEFPYNCAEYQQPDYLYAYGKTSYSKLNSTISGSLINIQLFKPIDPNTTGSYFINYSSFGFTNKNIYGAYDYSFNTLKINDKIGILQVGINTDADQYLSEPASNVNYKSTNTSALTSIPSQSVIGTSSTAFNQYFDNLGQGQIIKTSTNLQPNESLSIQGTYADSRIKLYLGTVILIGLIILFILISIFIAVKFTIDRAKHHLKKKDNAKNLELHLKVYKSYFYTIGISFVSSILIPIYTIVVIYIGQTYQYTEFAQSIMVILIIIISIGVYIILLFVPSIVISLRYDIKKCLWTFILTILWLILCLAIIALYYFFFPNQSTPVEILPAAGISSHSGAATNAPTAADKSQNSIDTLPYNLTPSPK